MLVVDLAPIDRYTANASQAHDAPASLNAEERAFTDVVSGYSFSAAMKQSSNETLTDTTSASGTQNASVSRTPKMLRREAGPTFPQVDRIEPFLEPMIMRQISQENGPQKLVTSATRIISPSFSSRPTQHQIKDVLMKWSLNIPDVPDCIIEISSDGAIAMKDIQSTGSQFIEERPKVKRSSTLRNLLNTAIERPNAPGPVEHNENLSHKMLGTMFQDSQGSEVTLTSPDSQNSIEDGINNAGRTKSRRSSVASGEFQMAREEVDAATTPTPSINRSNRGRTALRDNTNRQTAAINRSPDRYKQRHNRHVTICLDEPISHSSRHTLPQPRHPRSQTFSLTPTLPQSHSPSWDIEKNDHSPTRKSGFTKFVKEVYDFAGSLKKFWGGDAL